MLWIIKLSGAIRESNNNNVLKKRTIHTHTNVHTYAHTSLIWKQKSTQQRKQVKM